MITKDDYTMWKQEPTTIAWFEACQLRVDEGKEQLAQQAGIDPAFDSYVRGMIAAYREMMTFTVEDIE